MTRPMRILAPIALLGLAAVLAACGTAAQSGGASGSPATSIAPSSDTGASPGASADTSGSPAASASAGASGSPAGSGDAGASPSAGGDATSLIPETIGDITMTVTPIDPETYITLNPGRGLTAVLEALGKTPADLEIATATGGTETTTLFIDAVKVNGVDGAALKTAMTAALEALPGAAGTTETIAGKEVFTTTGAQGTTAVYVAGDTVYFITSADPALIEETLSALP
jgi:hypothetical protein